MRLLALVMAALLVVACSEREPVAEAGKRTYQGKRDTKPWDNEPLAYTLNHGSKWNKGDQASWEQQIKARQMTQNEYTRIGR